METVFPLEFMIDNAIPVPVTRGAKSIPQRRSFLIWTTRDSGITRHTSKHVVLQNVAQTNIQVNVAWIRWRVFRPFAPATSRADVKIGAHIKVCSVLHSHAASPLKPHNPPLSTLLPLLPRSAILRSSLERPCQSQLMRRRKEPRSIVCLFAL